MSGRRRNVYEWWALLQYATILVPVAVFAVIFLVVLIAL